MKMKYFFYDPQEGMEYFKTECERDAHALAVLTQCAESASSEGWASDDVDEFRCGVVTHKATKVNEKHRPPESEIDEEGFDLSGENWSNGWDCICDYEMEKLP